jgi:hypothetical protein
VPGAGGKLAKDMRYQNKFSHTLTHRTHTRNRFALFYLIGCPLPPTFVPPLVVPHGSQFLPTLEQEGFEVRVVECKWNTMRVSDPKNFEVVLKSCPDDSDKRDFYVLSASFGGRVVCEMAAANAFSEKQQPKGLILTGCDIFHERVNVSCACAFIWLNPVVVFFLFLRVSSVIRCMEKI